MNLKYKLWIDNYVANAKFIMGTCGSATEKMVKAFSELKRERGFVLTPAWGRREHWWCVAEDGSIVDPTESQFNQAGGISEYETYDPDIHGPEPTGKCMNCGEYCYGDNSNFCNDYCKSLVLADLNGPY